MIRLRILGCGSSGGVPRLGGIWGLCDPAEPRNRRRRCAALIERNGPSGQTRILVDTGPDLVPQLLDAEIGHLDAVIWTHAHADHIHGIDDLRQITFNRKSMLPGFADPSTAAALRMRFGYIFETPPGSNYPPVCTLTELTGPVSIEGAGGAIELDSFSVHHGEIDALGLTIATKGGGITYMPDVHTIPEPVWPQIGRDALIVDALQRNPHPSHAHLDKTLEWISRAAPQRAVLTNLHLDMDYATLCDELPPHIRPAYDGMIVIAEPPE